MWPSGVYDSTGLWGPAALFRVKALPEALSSKAGTKMTVS